MPDYQILRRQSQPPLCPQLPSGRESRVRENPLQRMNDRPVTPPRDRGCRRLMAVNRWLSLSKRKRGSPSADGLPVFFFSDAVAFPPCGIASGTHRKSGVAMPSSNASPVESYLLPSAYPLLTPRREELQAVFSPPGSPVKPTTQKASRHTTESVPWAFRYWRTQGKFEEAFAAATGAVAGNRAAQGDS